MIYQVHGKVLEKDLLGAVIDVMGLGLYLNMAEPESLTEGEDVTIRTYLAINQSGIELYGFLESADLTFFKQLLDVPGVGPKTALAIMRKAPRHSLTAAIAKRDLDYLTKVAGLGKKVAEKMLVELSEKVTTDDSVDDSDGEVFETLVALGYTEREARSAVSALPHSIEGKEARLKHILSAVRR